METNRLKKMKKEDIRTKKNKVEELAKDVLIALLSNPERYKYIAQKVESKEISQEEANVKNIHKAFKIAKSFYNYSDKQ